MGPRGKKQWPQVMWAWSNYGMVRGVEYTKRAAIKGCEEHTGEPWPKCKSYMEVWKCEVTPKERS